MRSSAVILKRDDAPDEPSEDACNLIREMGGHDDQREAWN